MENLTKKEFDINANPEFMGRYLETEEKGHVFEDAKGITHYIPKTAHTNLGASAIQPGDVCKIVKTNYGHDVYLLDAEEVKTLFV